MLTDTELKELDELLTRQVSYDPLYLYKWQQDAKAFMMRIVQPKEPADDAPV